MSNNCSSGKARAGPPEQATVATSGLLMVRPLPDGENRSGTNGARNRQFTPMKWASVPFVPTRDKWSLARACRNTCSWIRTDRVRTIRHDLARTGPRSVFRGSPRMVDTVCAGSVFGGPRRVRPPEGLRYACDGHDLPSLVVPRGGLRSTALPSIRPFGERTVARRKWRWAQQEMLLRSGEALFIWLSNLGHGVAGIHAGA